MSNRTESIQERALRESAIGGMAANFNRASAGYSDDVLLAMLGGLDAAEGFYAAPARRSSDTVISHRQSHAAEHGARIAAAAKRLRGYGLAVRISRTGGHLTVYGPQRGGRAGRYSA